MNSGYTWQSQPNEFQNSRFPSRGKPRSRGGFGKGSNQGLNFGDHQGYNQGYNSNFGNNSTSAFNGSQKQSQARAEGGFGGYNQAFRQPSQGFDPSFAQYGGFPQVSSPFTAPQNNFQAPFTSAFAQSKPPVQSAFAKASAFGGPNPGIGAPTASTAQPRNSKKMPFTTVPSGQPPGMPSGPPSGQSQQRREKRRDGDDKAGNRRDRKRDGKRNSPPSGFESARSGNVQPPHFSNTSFVDRARPRSNDTAILKPLPKPLTSVNATRDEWDVQNQQQMAHIEYEYVNNTRSLQSAYEQMSKMRDAERQEMERRGLVDSTETRKNLDDAITFVGSCIEMCPIFERVRRTYENNVMSLEKNEVGKVSRDLAVKAFSRPAAGQPPPLPSEVRPPTVLVSTLNYLVSTILPKLPASHPFLWDRTRSIRQDFTYQNYQGPEALFCFEVIARIHCISLHEMAKAASMGEEWSQQQELEQFNKCLQSLSEFYEMQPLVSNNEAEMRAYQLLSHFFDDDVASTIDRLPHQVSRHPLVLLAFELRALAAVSATELFSRVRKPDVPVTFRAVVEVHYNSLRMRTVRQLLDSMHKRTSMYSLSRFVGLLGFESADEAKKFCNHFDLIVSYSQEAGEEVDIRSWEESNVKDKTTLSQAFDPSLDSLIAQVNVLHPIRPDLVGPTAPPKSANIVPSGRTFSQAPLRGNTSLSNPSLESAQGQKPKFNVAAPPFRPSSSISFTPSGPNTRQHSAALTQGETTDSAEADSAATSNRLAEIKAKEAELRAIQEKQARQRAQEEENRRKEEERRNKMLDQKRLEDAERLKKEQQRQQQIRNEQQRQQDQQREQLQQRMAMRNFFVQETARRMLVRLIPDVCKAETSVLVTSVEMDKKRLSKKIVRRVKETMKKSLLIQQERLQRDRELETFRSLGSRKRVVSSRVFPVLENHLDAYDSGMDVENDTFGLSKRQLSVPKLPMVIPLDVQPLVPVMRKAYSNGLNQIRVAADWASPRGKWLRDVLQLESTVDLGSNTKFHLTVTPATNQFDVVLIDETVQDLQSSEGDFKLVTKSTASQSLVQLRSDIERLLVEYMGWYQTKLLGHRSLTIKRRRLFSQPPKQQATALPCPSPPLMDHPPIVHTPPMSAAVVQTQKLRAMIAEAKRLTSQGVP